uniref:Conserved oligomeric Golgi complex subunit 8 n=1 Tax=Rhabditophanes sp. KR3021 TaxID=114890 RepID=A0AC35TL67_9BILA
MQSSSQKENYQNWSYADLKTEKYFLSQCWDDLKENLNHLAFSNYKTYADASRTSHVCLETIVELEQFMKSSSTDLQTINQSIVDFTESNEKINTELETLQNLQSNESVARQLITLPKLMDKCVHSGYYESAYLLTKFALELSRNRLTEKAIVQSVAERLIESRFVLLDELFNKFASPIDLATSIKIISSIRQIPFVTNTQLKTSLLQYRDLYLEKLIANITDDSEFHFKMIDIFRDCMHDTIVLYLAVFPDTNITRKGDLKAWKTWNAGSQSFLLHSWALHNINRIFEHLNGIEKNQKVIDIDGIYNKLVNCSLTFSRIGLDFQNIIAHRFTQIVLNYLANNIDSSTKKLCAVTRLNILPEESVAKMIGSFKERDNALIECPLELCVWDDLCAYGQEVKSHFKLISPEMYKNCENASRFNEIANPESGEGKTSLIN